MLTIVVEDKSFFNFKFGETSTIHSKFFIVSFDGEGITISQGMLFPITPLRRHINRLRILPDI